MPNPIKQLIDLTKSGTPEGAKLGWETRYGGASTHGELQGRIERQEVGRLAEGLGRKDKDQFVEHLKSQEYTPKGLRSSGDITRGSREPRTRSTDYASPSGHIVNIHQREDEDTGEQSYVVTGHT